MAVRRPRRRNIRRRPRRLRLRRNPNQTSGNIHTKQYARCVEVVPFTPVLANTDYNYQFDISLFDRASSIAKQFKFYRAKRVVWTFLPQYNQYVASSSYTAPQMSMIMNRTGDNSNWGPAEYDAQGATPKTFIKQKIIAYKPNLCQPFNVSLGGISPDPSGPVPTTAILGNTPVYDKWIGTGVYSLETSLPAPTEVIIRADKTPYYGHSAYWYVTTPLTTALATVFCEVEWEFKDPLFPVVAGVDNAPSLTAVVASALNTNA